MLYINIARSARVQWPALACWTAVCEHQPAATPPGVKHLVPIQPVAAGHAMYTQEHIGKQLLQNYNVQLGFWRCWTQQSLQQNNIECGKSNTSSTRSQMQRPMHPIAVTTTPQSITTMLVQASHGSLQLACKSVHLHTRKHCMPLLCKPYANMQTSKLTTTF